MSGRRRSAILGLMILGVVLFRPSPARAQDAEQTRTRLRPSLAVEYFSRTIAWDEGTSISTLSASSAVLRGEVEFQKEGHLGLFLGYGFSNFNGLVFRQLPFSLDYQAGNIGSLIWGGDFEARFMSLGDFEIGIGAQFTMSLGRTKDFELPALNATGGLAGKGTWTRVLAGPVLRYTGYENFAPFLSVSYNGIWGTFTMNETIGDLGGSEEKKITARGPIGIVIGTIFEPSDVFRVKAEITAVPFKKLTGGLDTDYGASVKAVVSF